MSPSRSLLIILVLAFARPAVADDVADFLESRGLIELLAVHLEERMDSVTPAEREELLDRLAGIYAQLLEREQDAERRASLEERGQQLAAQARGEKADVLNLALLQASYRAAEEVADRHRSRLAEPDEVAGAIAALDDVAPKVVELYRRLDDELERLRRQESRTARRAVTAASERADRIEQRRNQAAFIAAWALYYLAELKEDEGPLTAAENLFNELLDFGELTVVPENVSIDRRGDEGFSRCILGKALCRSARGTSIGAIAWLELLEAPTTFAALRELVPAWRLVIHLDHREYVAARNILDSLDDPPLAWLQLAAARGIEDRVNSSAAAEVAQLAVTEMAAQGELEGVFRLAEKYGADAIGTRGFAALYVRGILAYYDGRKDDGDSERRADANALLERAVASFRSARLEPDADRFPAARADCLNLTAWSLYELGRLLEARDAFIEAAGELPHDRSADALWMAVVCLDELVLASDGSNLDLLAQLDDVTARFLAEHPAHPNAPRLTIRRIERSEGDSMTAVEALLAIAPQSDVFDRAQRRAVGMMYRLFRAAPAVDREEIANRMLPVAQGVLLELLREPISSDDARRAVVIGRQVLEVALADGIERLAVARRTLDALDTRRDSLGSVFDDVSDELAFRRVRERLLSGAGADADQQTEILWEARPSSAWTERAMRSMLVWASREMNAGLAGQALEEIVIRYGSRLLAGEGDVADAARFVIAEALVARWRRTQAVDDGQAAFDVLLVLRDGRPSNARVLRWLAEVAGGVGERQLAIDCWTALVSGLPESSVDWYEAKFELLTLVAQMEPARALRVLDQHVALDPEYGPPPWGVRLAALHERVRAEVGGTDGS